MAVESDLYSLRSMSAPEIAASIKRLAWTYESTEQKLRHLISMSLEGVRLVELCLLAVLLDGIVSVPDAAIRSRRCIEIEAAAGELNFEPEIVRTVSRQSAELIEAFDSVD